MMMSLSINKVASVILAITVISLVACAPSSKESGVSNDALAVIESVGSESCTGLSTLSLPHATISTTELIPEGQYVSPNGAEYTVPAFCRVHVVSKPTPDSDINIEVWMPTTTWNGRYYQMGIGGLSGLLPYEGMASMLREGNVIAAADGGHQGGELKFSIGHPEKVVDLGHRALKETTDKAKALVQAFYGKPPSYSYFSGCSGAGREAIVEVQRYPDDWDGILVGAPANNFTRLMTGFTWTQQALRETPNSAIPPAKLAAIQQMALSHCRADAHVVNSIATDPRFCRYDTASLICDGEETDQCLTSSQARALQKIYDGPGQLMAGERTFPGYEPTMERIFKRDKVDSAGGWWRWIVDDNPNNAMQSTWANKFFRDVVLDGKTWDLTTHSLKQGHELMHTKAISDETLASLLDADNPDLTPFYNKKGKMLMYFGWGDPVIPPQEGIHYYDRVKEALGDVSIEDFFQLYMVPGMGHCSHGPGTNAFGQSLPYDIAPPLKNDAQHSINRALEAWVERGIKPTHIIATKYINDDPEEGIAFTRPLCPYPQVAVYKGVGSTDDASSFDCRINKTLAEQPTP